MKGIILAGGTGSRLYPLTKGTNKHLLPLHNIPMIYMPISFLMMLGIKEFLITTHENYIDGFKTLLGDGSMYGINIQYAIQEEAGGIAEVLLIAQNFIQKDERFLMILGDNLFHSPQMDNIFKNFINIKEGAGIVLYEVNDPRAFGVAEIDHNLKVLSLEEKPQKPKSNLAVTGLYNYDYSAIEYAKKLEYSSRGELEITDINRAYMDENKLEATILNRSTTWLDCGTLEDIKKASNFISNYEELHSKKIGILEEVALYKKYITIDDLRNNIAFIKTSPYKDYLINAILNKN